MIAQGRPLAGAIDIPTEVSQVEAYALQVAASGRRFILEVGSAWGFSTVLLAQEAKSVVAVDPHHVWDTWTSFTRNLERYGVQDRVVAIRGWSQYELPRLHLAVGPLPFFDLAFIDGDHGEAVADQDLWWARRLVHAGGLIAVHDYTVRWPGVLDAVDRQLRGLDHWRVQRLYLAVNE